MKNDNYIKNSLLFKDLNEKEIAALCHCFNARIVRYEASKEITHRGARIEYLFYILEGVVRDTNISDDGEVLTLFDYKEGDIIGSEYISGARKTFPSDIIAVTDCVILLLDSFRFINPCNNFCPRHIRVMQKAYSMLSKQNIRLSNRIKELTRRSTKEKILLYLNNIRRDVKSYEFDIPYNRQELADYLGVERSALSKELSDLQKEGKIVYHKNHFKIIPNSQIEN